MATSEPLQSREDGAPPPFESWMDSFGIKDIVRPLIRTVSVWANNCSPPDASVQSMATAFADLALWFFYLDDYDREDYESFFDDCRRILDGSEPLAQSPPLLRAYGDVVVQVGSRGQDLGYYLEGRRKSLELIRQRIRFSRTQSTRRVTFEEYYAQRMLSVYVYQWMDMWEILGGFYLDPHERALPDLIEAKRAVTAWHILQNDARSLRRDIEAGSPNLVLLYAEQKSARVDDTIAALQGMFRSELESFQSASQSLLQTMPSARLRRYLELLHICLTGGETSFWEIKERYAREDLPQLLAAALSGSTRRP